MRWALENWFNQAHLTQLCYRLIDFISNETLSVYLMQFDLIETHISIILEFLI